MMKAEKKAIQMDENKLLERITVNPDIFGGKPIIRGRRLAVEQLRQRLVVYDRQQILIWQRMSPVEHLEIAFQAYQFALEAVRLTERQRHPDLSEEALRWRVIRRMQGDQRLGRELDARTDQPSRTE